MEGERKGGAVSFAAEFGGAARGALLGLIPSVDFAFCLRSKTRGSPARFWWFKCAPTVTKRQRSRKGAA